MQKQIKKINKKAKGFSYGLEFIFLDQKILILAVIFIFTGAIFYGSVFARGQVDESTNKEVDDLNRQIQEKRTKAEDLQKQQEAYAEQIKAKQTESADLANQISILDNRVAETQLQIDGIQLDMDSTDLEIKKINLEIIDKQEQMSREKEHVAIVLKLIYKQDQTSALEILLMNDSFSEFINQVKYLEDVNGELTSSLTSLQKYKADLDAQNLTLTQKATDLEKLKKEISDKKIELAVEKDNKTFILEQTKSSEQEYQSLLEQAKQEQAKAAADIVNIEKLVRQKLSPQQDKKLEANASGMIWPVAKNRINTYFHDPDYPFRYLFEHPGVDVRAAQGSPIYAAESGYVARAKDAGMGYSYVMLVHADGLATVYGHVSKILVKEDEYVAQGEVIGLSGATPGTPGAGPLTTGPHLHFEVRLNGIPVDPLGGYLQ